MRTTIRRLLLSLLVVLPALFAQQDRVAGSVNPRNRIVLKSSSSPFARPDLDRGPVDSLRRLSGIVLQFQPSAAQQSELRELLLNQQDPASASYRQWLQPEEFADRFGVSRDDLANVVLWAQSQGFRIEYQARTRTWIRLSGTVAQSQAAFRVQLHRYEVDGRMHFANSTDPSIPAALEPLISVIRGLDDFYPQPPHRVAPQVPDFTTSTGNHYLFPADVWTIYDMNPLLNAGYDGTGQKLVVVGQSNVDLADVRSFRRQAGLPANDPQIVAGGSDPGTIPGQVDEIDLDLEWAGAMAPNAAIYYVYADNSFDAIEYAIDNNLAPIITSSYTQCEAQVIGAKFGTAPFFESIAQQANALGITWVASSGDQGAAACETGAASTAVNGLAVNIPSSIPEVTAVGGSTFNDSAGGYWSAGNSAATDSSALKYIPEVAWNDSGIAGRLSASGGGASSFYGKPAWQTGLGVPNDGARDVPDTALAASPNHVGYAVVEEGAAAVVGGTSASAPVFAGMLALLNHYLVGNHLQSKAGLGNINPTLYRVAHSSSNSFHDVVSGGNVVACAINTPNCTNGNMGWTAGPGYDQVTGLGTIDLANLANQWIARAGAALSLIAAPSTIIENPANGGCPFAQYLIVQETNGYGVDLTRFSGAADYTSNIPALFGSLRVPPFGSLAAGICWPGATPPSSPTLEMDGTDALGNTVSARIPITFQSSAQAAGLLSVAPAALTLTVAAPSQSANGSIALTVPAAQQWTVAANPSGRESAWLSVSPQAGTGPAQIAVTAFGAGLVNGVYSASLVFQSQHTLPQVFVTNVNFTIGGSAVVKITGAENAASYQAAAAPGMYLSVFGSGLAPAGTALSSSTSPLPFTLGGVSATVNGIPAPVEYASPTQVNILLPFETRSGSALLSLSNNGQVTSYIFPVTLAAPGIFVDGKGSLAGAASAARGSQIAFYITGQGDISPAIASNTAVTPPATLPKPLLPVSVTIGGVQATVAFAGLPYYFEGLTQINVVVPSGVTIGSQAVVVTIGGIASPAAKLNVTN